MGSRCAGRRQWRLLAAVAWTIAGCLCAASTEGAISITNEVVPGIVTGDPWNVGGPLVVGELLTGEMTIDAGSQVMDTDGYVANGPGSTGVVSVNGAGTTWSNSGELRMGNSGGGTLNITSGATVSAGGNTRLGNLPGGTGTANVDGLGSTLTSNNFVLVGREGSGVLNVLNGGSVSDLIGGIAIFEGSIGAVTVDGAGSTWTNADELQVADGGAAFLNVLNGGVVSSPRGFVSVAAAGIGHVIVSGPDSQWNISDQLQVGYRGTGTLDITAGASVATSFGYLGSQFGSRGVATVEGAGSVWNNANELSVGYDGMGMLSILGGANVSNSLGTIGNRATGSGTAVVDGAGSMWINSGSLTVGNIGTGSLTISNGGLVTAGAIEGGGAINFDGGTLRLMSSDSVGNPLALKAGGGVLEVPASANVVTVSASLSGEGGLAKVGDGKLEFAGSGAYAGSTRVIGGVLQLNSATLHDGADVYLAPGAMLALTFSGADQVGALFLGGAAQPVGTYGGVGSGADFEIAQITGSGMLQVTATGLAGDYNDDGAVDAADYTFWRDRLGGSLPLANDPTLGVAADDYDRWAAQFGLKLGGSGSAGGQIPTPEPGPAMQLLLLAAGFAATCRR